MPFLNLDNNWSNLAQYYNKPFVNRPSIPTLRFVGFDDGLVRGGVLNAALATGKDVLRIGKFFASGKGALFVIKQVGLQKSNPKLDFPFNSVLNTNITRTYNLGLNTLTQVGVQAAGLHIVRHGLLPKFNSSYNYEKITLDNNELQGTKINAQTNGIFKTNSNRLVNYLSILNINSSGPVTLQEYNGGASSVFGLGVTTIKTSNIRTTISDSDLGKTTTTTNLYSIGTSPTDFIGPAVPNISQITNTSDTNPNLKLKLNGFTPLTNNEIQQSPQADLSSDLLHQLENSPLSFNKDISTINREYRVGTSYNSREDRQIDSINAINIVDNTTYYDTLNAGGTLRNTVANSEAGGANNKGTTKKVFNDDNFISGYFGRDIARLVFEFIDNDANTPSTDVLTFRAYIDDFNDGMNAKWNSYRYMGRGEEFYVYEGFTRDISVAFTMYAHNPEEMKPLYQKLNYLMSTFAPDYSSKNKMRGNIGYLTVGDYVRRVPGVFTDIKLSGFMDTHWEINLNYKLGDEPDIPQNVVPKLIKVGLSFKPIHNKLPRKSTRENPFKSNFILPGDSTNKYA
jgi:hypothetical protein